MIPVKLHQLRDSVEALQILANKQLPSVVSFRLSKLLKFVQGELKELEEARIKKAQELGKLSEDKSQYVFESDEISKQFSDEYFRLLNAEVAAPVENVRVEELSKVEMEPKHFAALDWLIVE